MTNLTLPIFTDAEKAREHLEAIRWPGGVVACPHCGVDGNATLVQGKSHRPGLYQCNACRETFTVTVGTVMEKSHIPLNKWVLGFHLMTSSKKGISAHQLHRMLGVTYKSAWFMAHRIRDAMAPAKGTRGPLGGQGKTVEADETYIGRKEGRTKKKGFGHKHTVAALVERGGPMVSFHIKGNMDRKTAGELLFRNADLRSNLMTDEATYYKAPGDYFKSHNIVTHGAGEYVRGGAHTNTIEGAFSIFKRGMVGTYQHCGEQHLHRYLAEFDFRYSNRVKLGIDDEMRATRAMRGAEGKRLTYRAVSG